MSEPAKTSLPSGMPQLRVMPMPADANVHGDVFGGWIMSQVDIAGVTERLTQQWPRHAIVWRSVNDVSTRAMKDRFEAAGYHAFASRQVYLFDCRNTSPPVGRDETRDGKLLQQADYKMTQGPWCEDDFTRMAWLYQRLYLDKYTWLNPVYTPLFLARGHAGGLLDLWGLRNAAGGLDGFIGFFDGGDTMTAPLVGYDTDLPAEAGLYRRLMALALKRAREKRLLYNMSAGAAAFKRHRGGTAALEYMMVYDGHLPFGRRLAAGAVRVLITAVGIPLLQGFAL